MQLAGSRLFELFDAGNGILLPLLGFLLMILMSGVSSVIAMMVAMHGAHVVRRGGAFGFVDALAASSRRPLALLVGLGIIGLVSLLSLLGLWAATMRLLDLISGHAPEPDAFIDPVGFAAFLVASAIVGPISASLSGVYCAALISEVRRSSSVFRTCSRLTRGFRWKILLSTSFVLLCWGVLALVTGYALSGFDRWFDLFRRIGLHPFEVATTVGLVPLLAIAGIWFALLADDLREFQLRLEQPSELPAIGSEADRPA